MNFQIQRQSSFPVVGLWMVDEESSWTDPRIQDAEYRNIFCFLFSTSPNKYQPHPRYHSSIQSNTVLGTYTIFGTHGS
jgi:hypothetical protein